MFMLNDSSQFKCMYFGLNSRKAKKNVVKKKRKRRGVHEVNISRSHCSFKVSPFFRFFLSTLGNQ